MSSSNNQDLTKQSKELAGKMTQFALTSGQGFEVFREACFQLAGSHGVRDISIREEKGELPLTFYTFDITENPVHEKNRTYSVVVLPNDLLDTDLTDVLAKRAM